MSGTEASSTKDSAKPAADGPLTFHSGNIQDTKAKEKRAVFLKVEEESGLKLAAKNFNKKLATGLDNVKATLNKPIDRPKDHPQKLISKKFIFGALAVVILVAAGGLAYYLIKNPQLTDPSLAAYLKMQEDFDAGYDAFQKLIVSASSPQQESELLVKRGYAAYKLCGKSCAEMIAADILDAEDTSPSADSALLYYYLESSYGSMNDAEQWLKLSQSRGQPSSWWKSDLWNNNNGATNAIQ